MKVSLPIPRSAPRCSRDAGISVVGIANNVHYGEPINASIAQLDRIGILHTGAGQESRGGARARHRRARGVRFGFVQRSSVYWPTNHEARKDAVGIAVIKGHTAYQIPTSRLKPDSFPPNRPGLPPVIITWADAAYLTEFKEDIAALRPQVDVLVASCHWGVGHDVLQYMTEIAHGAIDAGADIVVGHGPHYCCRSRSTRASRSSTASAICRSIPAIAACMATGSGMLVRVALEKGKVTGATFQFMRHNEKERDIHSAARKDEAEALAEIVDGSAAFGTEAQAQRRAGRDSGRSLSLSTTQRCGMIGVPRFLL